MLGKLIGGIAGLACGGPVGAVVGAAIGHAADTGALSGNGGVAGFLGAGRGRGAGGAGGNVDALRLQQARLHAMLGQRDQVFALSVIVLSAKLARIDGPVKRAEIDAFKRHFQIPPGSVQQIGQMFDAARAGSEPYEPYARNLASVFADAPGTLEDVLAALFAIARADGPLTRAEDEFLIRVHHAFGLSGAAWERARGAAPRQQAGGPDPYEVLGIERGASDEAVRARWKTLMRENHPDSLASRGVPADMIAKANERVARINAAWDRVKRERGI